jgi:neutral ceramidase
MPLQLLTASVRIAVILSAASLLLGCKSPPIKIDVPARQTGLQGSGKLLVGAAHADLTPIPGIPLGGYSVASKVSRGFWTRLRCRAIYVEASESPAPCGIDEDCELRSLVLVSTDLMTMPAGLGDRVVDLLHEKTAMVDGSFLAELTHVGRENLLITATETHQSPGNYFTSPLYNGFSSPQEGFDPDLFEFLARRIAIAIKKAYAGKQEAKLESSHLLGAAAEPYYIDNFVRNRSFLAFLLNPEADAVLTENQSRLSPCPVTAPSWPRDEYPYARACRAVHARVDLLRFRAKSDGSDIALAVFVPAHTTVLDGATEVYSGDVFNLASTMIETEIASAPQCGAATGEPVVAIFNGAQGDVSLQWERRTRGEAIRFAKKLTEHVCDRIDDGLRDIPEPVTVSYQYERVSVKEQEFAHEFDEEINSARTWKTAKEPKFGSGEFGGAEDQRTFFFDLGQKEGRTHYARTEHGPKDPPFYSAILGKTFDPVSDIGKRHYEPPEFAPVAVYKIGDVAIVGFPAEPTTVMARRIRKTVAKALSTADPPDDKGRVILVSFANGHISYVNTPEEYDRQTYEGASNYWGAGTGPFLQSKSRDLAGNLKNGDNSELEAGRHTYEIGTSSPFEPRNAWGPVWNPDDGLSNIVHDDTIREDPKRNYPTFCWRDAVPSLKMKEPRCARTLPEVSVKLIDAVTNSSSTLEIDSRPQANAGFEMVTVMVGVSRDETEWCSIWLRPAADVPPGSCQFEVKPIGSPLPIESDPFACQEQVPPPLRAPVSANDSRRLSPLEPNDGKSIACCLGLPRCSTTCNAGDL